MSRHPSNSPEKALVRRVMVGTRLGRIRWTRVRPWYWYGAQWLEKDASLELFCAHDGAFLTLIDPAGKRLEIRGFSLLSLRDLIDSLDPQERETEARGRTDGC